MNIFGKQVTITFKRRFDREVCARSEEIEEEMRVRACQTQSYEIEKKKTTDKRRIE